MKRFADLYDRIDQTTSTNEKVRAIADYLATATAADAAWAVYFLTGRKVKRLIKSRDLWDWALQRTGLSRWLMEESYSVVGDLAETVALLLDRDDLPEVPAVEVQSELPFAAAAPLPAHTSGLGLADWVETRLLPLLGMDRPSQMRSILSWWSQLRGTELFILNKLLTGEMRVGISQRLVIRALARTSNLDEATIAHRLTGDWHPSPQWYERLIAPGESDTADTVPRPYPFFLASPLTDDPDSLGDTRDWLIEYKYDGIRAQLIRRDGIVTIWSRGDELITDRFPEIRDAAARLPDGLILDGEILAWESGGPLPFSVLQRRIGRLALSPQILAEAPAAFIAFDLLEEQGRDVRTLPLDDRRARLEAILNAGTPAPDRRLVLSPLIEAPDWPAAGAARAESRARNVEGLMIKRRSSAYQVGRRRGDWWKWKIEPYSIDAVLVYAQPGHGRRANLLTDYTFAVWDDVAGIGGALTPVAKAYSGLNHEEITELDRWIRQNTTERFGPVRAVQPVHVFELHFEGIASSDRHRSGVALRFPRIARWRRDKQPADADTLARVKELMRAHR